MSYSINGKPVTEEEFKAAQGVVQPEPEAKKAPAPKPKAKPRAAKRKAAKRK